MFLNGCPTIIVLFFSSRLGPEEGEFADVNLNRIWWFREGCFYPFDAAVWLHGRKSDTSWDAVSWDDATDLTTLRRNTQTPSIIMTTSKDIFWYILEDPAVLGRSNKKIWLLQKLPYSRQMKSRPNCQANFWTDWKNFHFWVNSLKRNSILIWTGPKTFTKRNDTHAQYTVLLYMPCCIHVPIDPNKPISQSSHPYVIPLPPFRRSLVHHAGSSIHTTVNPNPILSTTENPRIDTLSVILAVKVTGIFSRKTCSVSAVSVWSASAYWWSLQL